MCVATNVAGESRRELNLEVLIPPQITASIESQIKHVDAESKDEILECPAQGYPKPRDRKISETNRNISISIRIDRNRLKIEEYTFHIVFANRYVWKKNIVLSNCINEKFEYRTNTIVRGIPWFWHLLCPHWLALRVGCKRNRSLGHNFREHDGTRLIPFLSYI